MEKKSERIWCDDFNAYNSLGRSHHTDNNGKVIEEMMDTRNLVCINNGRGTRLDINRNTMSCIDLKLVSANMANLCEWKVYNDSIGRGHFPVLCTKKFG